jgi:hypothetical protein
LTGTPTKIIIRIIKTIQIAIFIEVIEMKENYVYPARITSEGDMCQIKFLDFPDMVLVEDTKEDVIHSAQECLALEIIDYETQGKELPVPTENEKDVIYIHIWMPYFRNATKEIYVKKNVTIPQWLDILAKENKVNYSAALVKGIKMELGIKDWN